MAESSWKKSPPELVAAFATYVHGRPSWPPGRCSGTRGVPRRQLDDVPLPGSLIVRLADADAAALRDLGGQSFEPMPGRTMRGYVSLPPSVGRRPGELDAWVARAIAHVRTLAPK